MRQILLTILLCASLLFAQDNIWNKLDKGDYNVGFRVLSLYDSTRTINNEQNIRPVQISIWYPAKVSNIPQRLSYKDYFLLSAEELNFNISDSLKDKSTEEYKNLLMQNGVAEKAFNEWFDTEMLAIKNAIPIQQKFPLIVVAQGNYQSAHHQAFLCEFLASYGYVVVTTPSQTRISGQMTDDSQAVESAEEQVYDMEFAIRSLKNFDNADLNNIGLVGHSFGGRSILLLQMKNENVKCLVSLDGGLGLNTAINDIKKSPEFNPDKMNGTLLHFYEEDEEFIKPDFTLINSFDNSKRFLVKIDDMHHFYFTSIGFVSGTIDGFSPTSDNLAEKYKLICDLTRDFLNAVLTNETQSLKNLGIRFSVIADSTRFIELQMR
jgi:dienelactone hydrolase